MVRGPTSPPNRQKRTYEQKENVKDYSLPFSFVQGEATIAVSLSFLFAWKCALCQRHQICHSPCLYSHHLIEAMHNPHYVKLSF